MGSIDKACISGFLCRLCSEMHRTVIHIYGDQGQRLCLVEKINGYLPITISPTDPLPKTICTTCLRRVEQHYALLMKLTKIREERKVKLSQLIHTDEYSSSSDCSDDESPNKSEQSKNRETQFSPLSVAADNDELPSSSNILRRRDISVNDPILQVIVSHNVRD